MFWCLISTGTGKLLVTCFSPCTSKGVFLMGSRIAHTSPRSFCSYILSLVLHPISLSLSSAIFRMERNIMNSEFHLVKEDFLTLIIIFSNFLDLLTNYKTLEDFANIVFRCSVHSFKRSLITSCRLCANYSCAWLDFLCSSYIFSASDSSSVSLPQSIFNSW